MNPVPTFTSHHITSHRMYIIHFILPCVHSYPYSATVYIYNFILKNLELKVRSVLLLLMTTYLSFILEITTTTTTINARRRRRRRRKRICLPPLLLYLSISIYLSIHPSIHPLTVFPFLFLRFFPCVFCFCSKRPTYLS